jgi:hypothetical protein
MKPSAFIGIVFMMVIPMVQAFATGQIGDRLIYKGDTLLLFSNPLEDYLSAKQKRSINDHVLEETSTACYRGYLATWEIMNDSLFLESIRKGCQEENPEYFDLVSEFGSKKVFAGWYTGKILAPGGKLLFYVHDGYESVYETETEFQIVNGHITRVTAYDNSLASQSDLKGEKLKQFIYSNIQWEALPEFNQKEIRVFVEFSANENGAVDSVKVLRGHNPDFDNEAIRVVKSIPEWDVYFRHGKHKRISWHLPVVFSEKMKNMYKRSIE